MPKCKICGKDVITGEVVHSACRETETHKLMDTVCDKYCKYPEICADVEALDRHCDKCKVAELLGMQ